MNKIEINYVMIEEINPSEYNPRTIDEIEYKALCSSVDEFGMIDPLIVNRKNMSIIGGHMRYKVAKDKNMLEVPVVFVSLSPAKEKALNIVLNSPRVSGKFDPFMLKNLLDEIKIDLPDISESLNLNLLGLDYNFDIDQKEIDLPDLPSGEPDIQAMTFTVSNAQADSIKEALKKMIKSESFIKDEINENKNGTALALICEWYNGH